MAGLVLGPLLRHVSEDAVTVWVETDAECEVDVLGCTAQTFSVHGHHYALVVVDGLAPGSRTEYQVRLDGEQVWPLPDSPYPPSLIRTLEPGRPVRLIFGSCRHGTPDTIGEQQGYEPDALDSYALRMTRTDPDQWPDALLLLGDQVYADETSPGTQKMIRARRSVDEPPGHEVADFEEYTALYRESWLDPDIRWLFSTVPSSMIFDDHDIRDDWNTSYEWRRDIETTSWWRNRITGGLASYWVYQHIGNLSPADLAADPMFRRVHEVPDAAPLLDHLAKASDAEVDAVELGMGMRWSYRLDFGRVRMIMLDTRCGRVLTATHRQMMSDAEFEWASEQLKGDYDHLLIGSSLPWLLPWAIHDIENWNEAISSGRFGPRVARFGEKVRRAGDLEHWASFWDSFERLAELLRVVARGEHGGPAPASISVLSGDVHHAYVARAKFRSPVTSPVYQLTCSPVHNSVPGWIRLGFRAGWSRFAAAVTRPLRRAAGVRPHSVRWSRMAGPYFGNELATLILDGRSAHLELERARPTAAGVAQLEPVVQLALSPASVTDSTTAARR
jgi:hypothetical protein